MCQQMFLARRAMMNRAADFARVDIKSVLPFFWETEI